MFCPQVRLLLSLSAESCRSAFVVLCAPNVEMGEGLVAVTNLRPRSGAGPRLRLIWPPAAARGVLPDDRLLVARCASGWTGRFLVAALGLAGQLE